MIESPLYAHRVEIFDRTDDNDVVIEARITSLRIPSSRGSIFRQIREFYDAARPLRDLFKFSSIVCGSTAGATE